MSLNQWAPENRGIAVSPPLCTVYCQIEKKGINPPFRFKFPTPIPN